MNPDRMALLEAATAARATGEYAAALRHNEAFHAAGPADSLGSFWFSIFALGEWAALAAVYPPARQALLDLRDRETALLLAGQAVVQRFADGAVARRFKLVSELNQQLGDQRATCDTFMALEASAPDEARRNFVDASGAIVASGEYACAQRYLAEPSADMRKCAASLNAAIASFGTDESHPSFIRKMGEMGSFASHLRLHEQVLEGLGDAPGAQRLRADALAALDSDATRRIVQQELAQPGTIAGLVSEREMERDAQRARDSDATQ